MNLLRDLPDARGGEIAERLAGGGAARIERIVSHGQASPPGIWYDQTETEFVAVLAGAARLRFAGWRGDRAGSGRLGRDHRASPPPGRVDRPDSADRVAGGVLQAWSFRPERSGEPEPMNTDGASFVKAGVPGFRVRPSGPPRNDTFYEA
jgi:hypothetical protein